MSIEGNAALRNLDHEAQRIGACTGAEERVDKGELGLAGDRREVASLLQGVRARIVPRGQRPHELVRVPAEREAVCTESDNASRSAFSALQFEG